MKILYFALFLLLVGLVFFLLNRLVRKMAYPLTKRFLHCRIIPIVFVVLLAATNVYTVSYPLQILDKIINSPQAALVLNFVLPNRSYQLEYMLLVIIGLNLAVMALLLLVIGITKLIFCRRQSFVDIDDYYGFGKVLRFPWLFIRGFYEEQDDSRRLNGKGVTLGIWVKGFKWAFAALWIIEALTVSVSVLWGKDDWNDLLLSVTKSWYLLPMASFQLLQQIQFLLEDINDEEAGSAGSADIEERQCGSIPQLMEAYRLILGNSQALLLSDMKDTKLLQDGLGSNDLGNQQLEDCAQPDVLNVITNQLQQCGIQQSEQYQNALVELLGGRSINLCDQCEGRFLPYLCAYVNYYMSQGRTVLMLCRDRKRAEVLCEAVNQQMHRLNSLYSIWNITTLDGAENNSNLSMLVCSVGDFLNYRVFDKRQDFAEDLFCTILADSVDLLTENLLCTERLFGALRGKAENCQYIFFSDINNDALRTASEQAIRQEVIPFSDDTTCGPNAGVMVWSEESYYRLQLKIGIGSQMSPYMGAALPLALVAVKYDFPRVYLIGRESHGVFSFNDILSMSAKDVAKFVGKNINLKSLIRYQLDEALQKQDLSVTVVYDTDHNFLNTITFWQKYSGTQGSLLHIISPAYALREYFAANYQAKHFDLKNTDFNALIPHFLGTKTSHMFVLLILMCGKGLTEQELMDKAKEYGWDYPTVDLLLYDCLKTVLALDEIHGVYECFHFEEEKRFREDLGKFEINTRITLIDSTICKRMSALSGYAGLVSKNNQIYTLPVLSGNVYNYYLPQQIIPVNGYLYQVRSICDGNIHAEQALPQNLPTYSQISDFTFSDYTPTDLSLDIGSMNLRICTADITRRVLGYVSCNRGNHFSGDSDFSVNSLGEEIAVQVNCANVLEINIRRSEFGDQAEAAARLLAYLLQDFAKTLFPATYQNLFCVLALGWDMELPQRILSAGRDAQLSDLVRGLIPNLNNAPVSDSEFITVYVAECSCIEFGMVQMLFSRYKKVISMLREYLSWYLESNQPQEGEEAQPGGRYLHFGGDRIPDIFAPEALLTLCRKIAPEAEPVETETADIPNAQTERCTFCGRPTMFPVVLADNRKMCLHCKDHQLTQKEEIKTLFTQTVQYITEGYQISLPRNIHVRFQSASAIAKEAGSVDGGRILGFYNSGNHQLWLEARGPKIAMQSTLIHELTHAWQFYNSDFSQKLQKLLQKYPKAERKLIRLLILEGHSVYMEVETMRRMHEESYADRIHASYMQRTDEYGTGYRLVRDYLIEKSGQGSHMTPFVAMTQLLQDLIDGKVVIK